MRIVVESLKRLFKSDRLTEEQMKERVTKGTVTEAEYEYITGEPYKEAK